MQTLVEFKPKCIFFIEHRSSTRMIFSPNIPEPNDISQNFSNMFSSGSMENTDTYSTTIFPTFSNHINPFPDSFFAVPVLVPKGLHRCLHGRPIEPFHWQGALFFFCARARWWGGSRNAGGFGKFQGMAYHTVRFKGWWEDSRCSETPEGIYFGGCPSPNSLQTLWILLQRPMWLCSIHVTCFLLGVLAGPMPKIHLQLMTLPGHTQLFSDDGLLSENPNQNFI